MTRLATAPIPAEYRDRLERGDVKKFFRAPRHATRKRPPGGSGPSELVRKQTGNRGANAVLRRTRNVRQIIDGLTEYQRCAVEGYLEGLDLSEGDVQDIRVKDHHVEIKMMPSAEKLPVQFLRAPDDDTPKAPVFPLRRRRKPTVVIDEVADVTEKDFEKLKQRWVGAKEKAKSIGRSYTYVKDHARELGGRKNRLGRWEFPA